MGCEEMCVVDLKCVCDVLFVVNDGVCDGDDGDDCVVMCDDVVGGVVMVLFVMCV